MSNEENPQDQQAETIPAYEAPAIEEVVTPESIVREAHYAGVGSQGGVN
jgi:hypothetical protein